MIRAQLSLAVLSALRPLPAGVANNDFILASFPKSGNTWVRFVFAHLIANCLDGENNVNFYTIERFSPAVGGKMAPREMAGWEQSHARPIKTHYNWSRRYSRHRSVLLVREPTKCLTAFCGYLAAAHGVTYRNENAFLSSWRHGVPAWVSFHRSWIHRADFVLRYEDLVADPARWFVALTAHLSLPYGEEAIADALEQSSRSAMKEAERHGDPYHDAGYTFVRGEGEARSEVIWADAARRYIEDQAGGLYAELRSGPRDRG